MISKQSKINSLKQWEPRCETFAGEVCDNPSALRQPPFPKRGDIYWVELGENIGSEANDFHPCVIASRDGFNRNSGTVTILPGTSAHLDPKKNSHASSYRLHPGELFVNPSSTSGLPKKTLFQAQQIKTISRNRLLAKIGRLNNLEFKLMNAKIKQHLNL